MKSATLTILNPLNSPSERRCRSPLTMRSAPAVTAHSRNPVVRRVRFDHGDTLHRLNACRQRLEREHVAPQLLCGPVELISKDPSRLRQDGVRDEQFDLSLLSEVKDGCGFPPKMMAETRMLVSATTFTDRAVRPECPERPFPRPPRPLPRSYCRGGAGPHACSSRAIGGRRQTRTLTLAPDEELQEYVCAENNKAKEHLVGR